MLVLVQVRVNGGTCRHPKRRNAAEEGALQVALVRVIAGASTEVDKSQVPWGQFAGIHHSSCAAGQRISHYRLVCAASVYSSPPTRPPSP